MLAPNPTAFLPVPEEEMSRLAPCCFRDSQSVAMPRSLNDPDGCSASSFRYTGGAWYRGEAARFMYIRIE